MQFWFILSKKKFLYIIAKKIKINNNITNINWYKKLYNSGLNDKYSKNKIKIF